MDRRLALLLLLAAAMRLLGSVLYAIPGRDGVHYLWLAQQWAAGRGEELFASVFHPGYPFLVGLALQLAPELDPVRAGQLVAGACSALAVLPLWSLAKHLFGRGAAAWAVGCFALGAWFVRHPAECLSEGPFHLAAAAWAAALLRERARPVLAGLAAGAAFLVRPEGGALAFAGVLLLARRRAWRGLAAHALAAGLAAAVLPLGSWWTGHGFVATPKAAFNWEVGAGGASSAVGHYLLHLVRLPGDAWEGLGYLVTPLVAAGVWLRRRCLTGSEWALLLPFLLQCAVIPLLRSNLRFVSGLGVLLLPFAGLALATLAARWPRWRWLLVVLLVAAEAKLWLGTPADRTIERELGRWLATQLAPQESLASDMPRVTYFAGLEPPPPRTILAPDLLAAAAAPGCRFVALRVGRTAAVEPGLRQAGFAPVGLPAGLLAVVGAAEVQVWRRQ